MINIVDRLVTREITKEEDLLEALSDYPELEYCDFLDYPGDVDDVLISVKAGIRNDWEKVQSLRVIYGKWSKILMAVLYFKENSECEIQFLKKNFDLNNEREVYAKLEEEKDEPEILDWENFRWGARMSILLTALFSLLILLPPQHPNTLWSAAGIAVFFGSCYTLGSAVSSVDGSYVKSCEKPKTMIYRVTGNVSLLVIILATTTNLMWSRMAGQTVFKDGGSIKITYREKLFDYERKDIEISKRP